MSERQKGGEEGEKEIPYPYREEEGRLRHPVRFGGEMWVSPVTLSDGHG
jgi:hypothetical protein